MPELRDSFRAVVQEHTAGSPVQEEVVWTNLSPADIAERLAERGTPVSVHIVGQLLEEEGFRRRQAQKTIAMGSNPNRNAQFLVIDRLRQEYSASPNPILSIDSKKRELLGNFYRDGKLFTKEQIHAFDHDYPSFADGVILPHGLYDLKLNRGYLHLGTSHDTSEFACDCLEDWWLRFGRKQYPAAKSLLLLCDGGGSNNARTYLFKADLQRWVDRLGLPVRVAHYPPYTSKYNPIEHRLFAHVHRALQGVLFTSAELVRSLAEQARTRTGLQVVADVWDRVYTTGRRVAQAVRDSLNLLRDEFLPQWNYRILPGRK